MVYAWCKNCCRHRRLEQTELGFVCCTGCGSVVEDSIYSEEPTFVKDSSGLSRVSGNYVNTIQSENGVSRQRTLEKARDFINHMIQHLGVGGGDYIAQPAVRFYEIAIEKNFLRGRKFMPVAAACLYIVCRENNKPFLLIEFSEFLRVNVYVLGAVFLQLCKVLHLQEHPIVQKPVDPSLFIHRFTRGLLGEVNHEVEKTALRIMASMKLNWMQTGRKPSGLCGAALYISALSHGFKYSKTDIVKAVHICEATLTKRLIEFEGTESGGLTIEEFNEKAEELERNYKTAKDDNCRGTVSEVEDLLCEHKGSGQSHFAHGLCVTCYQEFIKISGGLDGGLEPPAFQRAERERLEMTCANKMDGDSLLEPSLNENSCKNLKTEKDTGHGAGRVDHTIEGVNAQCEAVNGIDEETVKADDLGIESDNESENFSDIDDIEVATYLYNEEEKRCKKIIWEYMNREYLEEQAAKEAEAAAREAMMAKNGSSQVPDAVKQLYDEASANYAKLKKGRQQKRAAEAKNPQTAAEAAHQMLSKKRISSKLNHDRLKELFDEPVIPDNLKRSRTEAELEKNAVSQTGKSEVEGENDEDELETVDEIEDEGDYQGDTYHDDYEEYADFDEGFL